MIGKVPRGLTLEVWGYWEEHKILRIYAEDLAEYLNVDGFPADIRKIHPGKSVNFPLNPKSMSATSVEAFTKWKKAEEWGTYSCRVVFDEYTSPRLEISSPDTERARSPKAKDPEIKIDSESKELFGIQLRRILEKKNQALVSYHRGSGVKDDYFIRLRICPKDKFEKLADRDGSAPLEKPFHNLVTIGEKLAKQEIGNRK